MTDTRDGQGSQHQPLPWVQQPPERTATPVRAKLLKRYREGGASNVLIHARLYLAFHRRRLSLEALARVQFLLARRRTFQLDNKTYRYLFHPHNSTWRTERCVEIPLAIAVLEAWSGKRVLEVGNVLQYYTPIGHQVLDKYEHAGGVINADVVDFCAPSSYDLILSVSTLEHVGWDEADLEPDKVVTAFAHLTEMLAPGGRLWVTIPRGYHRYLDRYVDQGIIPFTDLAFLRRTSTRDWHQVSHKDVHGIPYGVGFQGAIALTIGIVDKPNPSRRSGVFTTCRP